MVRVYRANVSLVGDTPKRYNREMEQGETSMGTVAAPQPNAVPQKPEVGLLSLSFLLSAETKADLHIRGPVGPDDLEMLRDQLEITIRALNRKKDQAPQ